MRNAATLTLATLLGALALTGNAHAKSEYVGYIPNGTVNDCLNCHPGNDTGQLNGFGQISANQAGKPAEQWWAALEGVDSDGDGQTNGQEMGDPCGEWLIGLDPPRTTAISNPGDPGDVSADPDTPACGGAGGAGGGAGGGDPGTTTAASTGAGAGSGSGSGSGNGSGSGAGVGGASPSSGAGRADPPLPTPGSCSTNPATPGPAWDIGILAGAALMLARFRRRKRK